MNHLVRISLVVGLSIAAVLIILLSTEHFGPHTHMNVFLAETIRTAACQDVVIEEYVEANLPRLLQRDMIRGWFHGSVPCSRVRPMFQAQPISATGLITYPVENITFPTRPLPYPPEELWCVRVKSADPTVPRVLLLAFHKDIYTASWVLHEPVDAAAVVSVVGCHFSK